MYRPDLNVCQVDMLIFLKLSYHENGINEYLLHFQVQYIPESWTPPCMLDPPIIPAVKRRRAKVYQWMLWGLIWRSLTPLITMTLNPLVWELIGKLIFIHFLMQLLSTFEHALGTFAPNKIILNTRWAI